MENTYFNNKQDQDQEEEEEEYYFDNEDNNNNLNLLPIESFKEELILQIKLNQIIICIGETGSGKTTKIPQYFLDSNIFSNNNDNNNKLIAITQPRRVAAITVCQRVAEERNCIIGDEVGYTVRFDDMTTSKTKIKFMTDGILVRECLYDPNLSQYNAIMLDEAHERSIHTDILFGLVKQACIRRPDLKVLITSATLDITKFSTYFHNCPVVRVPGRLFPVDIYHSKIRQVMTTSGPSSNAYISSAVKTVLKIHQSQEEGHILLFLTGQEEIEKACEMIRTGVKEYSNNNNNNDNNDDDENSWDDNDNHDNNNNNNNNNNRRRSGRNSLKLLVIPLYASLTPQAQKLAFKSVHSNVRKCVVATNIAETSVTVPGIRYVVDPGYVKQKCYDPSRRMESLLVVPISQVSAQQRAGRAGRTGPGQCYRLYSTQCYNSFFPETIPEIKRCNVTNTLLYLKVLGIIDVIGFDFMDPPSESQIIEGLVMLHMLGAIDGNGDITKIGRGMSNFPLEPSLSRMLYESTKEENDCIEQIATICAMLSVENIYYYPNRNKSSNNNNNNNLRQKKSSSLSSQLENDSEKHEVTDAHMRLWKSDGDHFTFLNIYNKWVESGSTSNWCEDNFIRFSALKTARNIRTQLISEAKKITSKSSESSRNKIECNSNIEEKRESNNHHDNNNNQDNNNNDNRKKRNHEYDSNENEHKNKKRSRRDLENAIKQCLTSGLYMNTARRCANETAYRSMPFQISKDHNISNDWQLQDMLEEVKLLHLHPTCGYGGEIGDRPPEYVLYQDLLHTGKLLMRYVVKVDYTMIERHRRKWNFIHPYRLSNRTIPRQVINQTSLQESNNTNKSSFEQNSNSNNNTEEIKLSSIEAAKLRFLQRKAGVKK